MATRSDHPDSSIVIWDPHGDFWQGAIVSAEEVPQLEMRGVATLPVERELLKGGAISGFFFRAWGSGWPLEDSVPRMCCPMALRVVQFATDQVAHNITPSRLNWTARVVPSSPDVLDDSGRSVAVGSIRLAADSGQGGMTGTVAGGGSTLTIANNVGATHYFDFTGVTLTGSLTVTTGSGTAAVVSAAAFAGGRNLLQCSVVASHFVSCG